MGDHQNTHVESIIMGALSTLTSSQLSSLSLSLSSTFHHHRHRLVSLLSSPSLFALTLNHLSSLSLPHKSLLVARHLLSFLHLLAPFLPSTPSPPRPSYRVSLRDLDSVLLLLYFCQVRQQNPGVLYSPPAHWQGALIDYYSDTMLEFSSGFTLSSPAEVLGSFVDTLANCMRFVGAQGCGGGEGREVAAMAAAVVALPSVEVKGGGGGAECVICREEMREGRDVCQLPCQHLFHWMCVLPWLKKRNTCPCCRFRLATDDVYGEIQRLWEVILKVGSQHFDEDQRTLISLSSV